MTFEKAALLLVTAGVATALGQTVPWNTISPERAGLDAAKLERWRDELAALPTSGLLVIRRGEIAYEWYARATATSTRIRRTATARMRATTELCWRVFRASA